MLSRFAPALCFPLQSIQDAAWQARPAVLATKIALLDSSGQAGQAATTLGSALQHWRAGASLGGPLVVVQQKASC